MDDALLVRRFERVGDLPRDRQRLVERQRPARDAIGQRVALDQLQDERARARRCPRGRRSRDVRMVERGEHLRFALEAGEAFGIGGEAPAGRTLIATSRLSLVSRAR